MHPPDVVGVAVAVNDADDEDEMILLVVVAPRWLLQNDPGRKLYFAMVFFGFLDSRWLAGFSKKTVGDPNIDSKTWAAGARCIFTCLESYGGGCWWGSYGTAVP